MAKHELLALVWKEGKVYVADCPQLGVASQGVTKEEAVSNLKEAVELYLEEQPLNRLPRVEFVGAQVIEVEHGTKAAARKKAGAPAALA